MTMPADACLQDCPEEDWRPGCAACPCVPSCDPDTETYWSEK